MKIINNCNKNPPKVSVVLATYNGSKTIKNAIKSIVQQTYPNLELIVVDDGSTDNTYDVAKSFKRKLCLKVIRNKSNLGLARSLNLGIAASSGDFIARMDDDDLSMPERISEQVKFMTENPSVDVLGTGVILVNDSGEPIRAQNKPQNDDEIKQALCRENPLFHPTVLMRRAFLTRMGGYDETLKRKEDYELWGRAAESSTYHNLLKPLLHYRVKQYKNLKALPAGVKVRLRNGLLMHCFFRALFWSVVYVAVSVARKYGYQQRAHRSEKL